METNEKLAKRNKKNPPGSFRFSSVKLQRRVNRAVREAGMTKSAFICAALEAMVVSLERVRTEKSSAKEAK